MRIKALLTSILLASTTIAGVASASPIVRDHRDQPTVTYKAPVRYQNQVRVHSRPSWMINASANLNYGFQVDADGDSVQPYTYGNDPYVEGIARGEWTTLASGVSLAYNQESEVNVDLAGPRLQALELQATGGRDFIREVHVLLNDGREIKLNTNRTLDVVTGPNMRLDLGPQASCGVRRIEIFGSSTGKGQFRVLGA